MVTMRFFTVLFAGTLFFHSANPGEAPALLPTGYLDAVSVRTPDPQDEAFFENKVEIACAEQNLPERVLTVARSFIGTPYRTGTLNTGPEEQLTVNLRALDCWTFMEASLAIALAAEAGEPSFDTFQHYIQQLVSPADGEQRAVIVERPTRQFEFGAVALGVGFAQRGMRRCTVKVGRYILAAGK